ncbi:hypothetical protein OIO90_003344 [Microbotryomycetes sp. JL221]|nr:hypothetical protein OIO90_003344 [Microbotryomycetes sp. JL221]
MQFSGQPTHWPPAVRYLTVPEASPKLPKELKTLYCANSFATPNPPPKVAIRIITEPADHPALGQRGLFYNGSKKLEPRTWIRDYIGIVHTDVHDQDPTSDYDLTLERRTLPAKNDLASSSYGHAGGEGKQNDRQGEYSVVAIDATKAGNEARFVNDYRGVAEKPNAVFELREWHDRKTGQVVGRRMAIWAGPKGVDRGAEICVSYGKGFWQQRKSETGGT